MEKGKKQYQFIRTKDFLYLVPMKNKSNTLIFKNDFENI